MTKAAAPLGERDVNVQSAPKGGKQGAGEKPTPPSKKRKATASDENVNLDEVEIPEGTLIKWDANQIRNKIRTMLNNSEMTVAKMQDAIGTSGNSYYRFMNQSGPTKGTQSDVYMGATEYFLKREAAGLSMPRKKKAKTTSSNGDNNGAGGGQKKSKAEEAKELDVSDIKLEGEDTNSVPIYLTCDDVRSLINAHLRNTSASQASFCRSVTDMYNERPSEGTGTGALKTFLSSNGVLMGASSPIFYGAYVYFEKLRIKQGKPKSKKRKEMEEVWGSKGLGTTHDMKQGMIMRADQMMFTDKYGHVETHGRDWLPPDGWRCWGKRQMGK